MVHFNSVTRGVVSALFLLSRRSVALHTWPLRVDSVRPLSLPENDQSPRPRSLGCEERACGWECSLLGESREAGPVQAAAGEDTLRSVARNRWPPSPRHHWGAGPV